MLRAMLTSWPAPLPLARCATGWVLAAMLSTSALAAPADFAPLPPTAAASAAVDAVGRFLVDRGLIGAVPIAPAAEGGFVSQVGAKASDMVVTAMNFLGVRYRRGGNSA